MLGPHLKLGLRGCELFKSALDLTDVRSLSPIRVAKQLSAVRGDEIMVRQSFYRLLAVATVASTFGCQAACHKYCERNYGPPQHQQGQTAYAPPATGYCPPPAYAQPAYTAAAPYCPPPASVACPPGCTPVR